MSNMETPWWSSSEHIITEDIVRDFFDLSKPVPKIKGYTPPSRPISSAARKALKDAEEAASKPPPPPTLPVLDPYYIDPQLGGLFIPGDPASASMAAYTYEPAPVCSRTDVFDHYDFKFNSTPSLPIDVYKQNILSTIEANQVTIIEGSTGSGKSTQVY